MSDNIDLLRYAAETFRRLYEAFPCRIGLDAHVISGVAESEDDFLNMPRGVDICRECIWWLEQAGFIWFSDKVQAGAIQAVLTPKGLEVLKLVPSSLEAQTSVGDTLVSLAKGGSVEAGKGLISLALTEAFKLFSS
ncbi:MAG: hypothetical protein EPN20_08015 [Magnetospirillum sp.]|nr:MAG: hypothetical protein EPN20_08015 [Magnetospirillum sp.]